MREIGAGDAESDLGRVLDWVAAGEEVVITRSGKAVARLLPPAIVADEPRVLEAIRAIRTMRKGAKLGGLGIKELIEEGRR